MVGTNPAVTLAVTRTVRVQAVFGTAISTNVLGSGSLQLDPDIPLYPYGTKVGLAALPQAGNYFLGWHGALTGTNTPTSLVVTVPSPVVTATFASLSSGQYALTLLSDGKGKRHRQPLRHPVQPRTDRLAHGDAKSRSGFSRLERRRERHDQFCSA